MPAPLKIVRKAHEATELAKLAVDLCRLRAGHSSPEEHLGEALDLIIAAGNLIEKKELELYGQKK